MIPTKRKRDYAGVTLSSREEDERFKVWPFTVTEFMFIRKNLKTEDIQMLDKMIEVVKMWQWRENDASAPIIIIEMTLLIIQGIAFDRRHVIDKIVDIPNAEYAARFVYATVLSRFINHINQSCAPLINEGGIYGNMYKSAQCVQIPSWIVRMRHDVAHENMPTLDVLRQGIIFCRDCMPIEVAFMPPGKPVPKRPIFSDVSMNEVRRLLMRFCRLKFLYANDFARKELPGVVLDLKSVIFSDPRHVTTEIVDLFIIKSMEQLRDMELSYNNEKPWKLPVSWKKFWFELVLAIQECAVMGSTILYMSSRVLSSDDHFHQVQYAAWVSHMLDRLKLTSFSVAYLHLAQIGENMLKSKSFYSRDSFVYIVNQMSPFLSSERKQHLIQSWDEPDEREDLDETTFMVEAKGDDVHFGLVALNTVLGLVSDQNKKTLDLSFRG